MDHPKRPPLFAVLYGGEEINPAQQAAAGDVNGRGSATIVFQGDSVLCYGVVVAKTDTPTQAHIHDGTAGTNGPIVVTFETPNGGDPDTASGCVTDVDPALARCIRQLPNGFYVNVHTEQFPDGAMRGQLF